MIHALLRDDEPLSLTLDGREMVVMSHAFLMRRLAEFEALQPDPPGDRTGDAGSA